MGPRNHHWITEGNRRESEKRPQAIEFVTGFIPFESFPGSRKGYVWWPRIHLVLKGIFSTFDASAGRLFYGSIGSIWHMWNQLVATVYRRAGANRCLGER